MQIRRIMTETEMTGLLLQLADLGVTGIRVHYDGGGDDGSIDSIDYCTEKINEPSDILDNADNWSLDGDLYKLAEDSAKLIHDWVEDQLLQQIENWWDDQGGHGDVCICVPSGKYIIYNSVRVVEYEEYTHDGNLINKTLE
jgi:hypothetical protein